MNDLTEEAEDWATSGKTIRGESQVCMGPKSSLMYYGYSRPAVIENFHAVTGMGGDLPSRHSIASPSLSPRMR